MEDSITREYRLNLLLAVGEKVHNEKWDAFYAQKDARELVEKSHLIDELLLDDSRIIPAVILVEAKSIMPQ